MVSSSQLSYLALGDSYTIGEGVAQDGRWPVQLAAALRAEGVALADPRIIATTGWTTDELEWGLDAAEPLGSTDTVAFFVAITPPRCGAWPRHPRGAPARGRCARTHRAARQPPATASRGNGCDKAR